MTTTESLPMEQVLAEAEWAASSMATADPKTRAAWLRSAADALDGATDELVPVAMRESHLPEQRLRGEVARSSGQLRLFAAALLEGSLSEPIIDTADADAVPTPRPDLRRMLLPVGPVLVFAAGNFPFAFSVGGGDTAAALAAGCPVVVKTHPGHPETSARTAEVLGDALGRAGAPRGALGIITGYEEGPGALADRRIRAAAFTGSVSGGVTLHGVAASREDPIPFYGELGSINPAFVTPAAVLARGASIAEGFVTSYTLGVGQFCTKPGLLFLPRRHGLEEALLSARQIAPAAMLYASIGDAYVEGVDRLRGVPGVEVMLGGLERGRPEKGIGVAPTLLRAGVENLLEDDTLLDECFGPVSVVVEYDDPGQFETVMSRVGGSLTATVHAEQQDEDWIGELLTGIRQHVGRVVWNGWPTGVAVAWAMHHGGPFPATVGSLHTSVGVTAVRRFQRPVCFQDTPEALLPLELRDGNPLGLARRIDGRFTDESLTRP